MKILFIAVFAILNYFGALVPVQNLTAMVTQSGIIADPVRAFVIIGLSLILIVLITAFCPSIAARLKAWESALLNKLPGVGSGNQLADAMQRIAALEAQAEQFKTITAAAGGNQVALATGQGYQPTGPVNDTPVPPTGGSGVPVPPAVVGGAQ